MRTRPSHDIEFYAPFVNNVPYLCTQRCLVNPFGLQKIIQLNKKLRLRTHIDILDATKSKMFGTKNRKEDLMMLSQLERDLFPLILVKIPTFGTLLIFKKNNNLNH